MKTTFLRKTASVLASASVLLASFVPLSALAASGTLTVLINGAPPSPFCVAGPITVSGSGTTGQQGGTWHLVIGWGDGTASTSPTITSGSLSGSNTAFSYSQTRTLSATSTGITVVLYHSQPSGQDGQVSGQDGQVIVVNQCVAAPTQGVVVLAKHVVNDNLTPGTATASDFTLSIGGFDFTGSETGATPGALLFAGTYPITETGPGGYDRTSTICGDGLATTTSDSMTVVAGHNYACTVTNNDTAPTTATLTLVKQVTKDNGGVAEPTDWTLSADGPTDVSGVTGSGAITNAVVDPGTYNLSESGPFGYSASAWACTGTGTIVDDDTITLAAGNNMTCTITNDDIAPFLTFIKEVINGFGGTALASAWTLFATGPTPLSGAGGVTSGPTFSASSYTLSETGGPSNYASSLGCVTNGGATTTSSTLALSVGDTATCIFRNSQKQPGVLHVIKNVINDNPEGYQGSAIDSDFTMNVSGGNANPASFSGDENGTDVTIDAGASFSVSETGEQTANYGMTLSGDCSGTMPEGGDLICTVTNNDNPPTTGGLTVTKVVVNDNGGTKVVSDFPLMVDDTAVTSGESNQFAEGSYTVSETGDSHYATTYSGACDGTPNVTVTNGQSATCTITNDDIAPSLTLVKNVNNENGGTATVDNWTLTAVGATTTISGAGGVASDETLQAGAYTLSESDGPSGYEKGEWSCTDDDTEETVDVSEDQVTLGLGDHVTCSITNTFVPTPLDVTPPASVFDDGRDHQIIDTELVQLSLSGTSTDAVGPQEDPRSGVVSASMSLYRLADAQTMDGEGFFDSGFPGLTCSNLEQVPIEIIALSLTSVEPLTVRWDPVHQSENPLTSLERGVYCAVVNATDNAGNIEHTTIAGPFAYTFTPPPPPPPVSKPQCSDGIDNDGDGRVDYPSDNSCSDSGDTTEGNDGGGWFGGGAGQVLGASVSVGQASVSTGQVLGVSCGLYMDQHLRKGSAKNKPDQVTKLQQFLNKGGFGKFAPTGTFGPLTEAAAKAFQSKYADEILKPWSLSGPTGLVYLTTIRQLNLLECPELMLPLPALVPWNQNPNAQ